MRSTEKPVLFVQHKHEGKTAMYPVSVHTNDRSAKVAKANLSHVIKSGDAEKAKALAPNLKLTADGKLPTDVKFAIVVLPYEPQAAVTESADDTFEF